MAQVNVSIAGRQYRMACDDGQEEHLTGLAARLDARITELREEFGEIGDQRITVMAALTIADALSETERRCGGLDAQLAALRERDMSVEGRVAEVGDAVADRLSDVARRIERLARSLDGAARE